MHRILNNYVIFSHFLFYGQVSNSKYFSLAVWSEWFEIQAFMTYHRVCNYVLSFVWRQLSKMIDLLGVHIQAGYWYNCIALHPLPHLQATLHPGHILTKCDKFEKNNIIASKKSLKKIHLDEFLQQRSKISELHRTLDNYVIFYYFLFYTKIFNSKYFSFAVWNECFEMQTFMAYHRVCN